MKTVQILGCGFTKGDIPPFDPQAERWGVNKLMFMRYGGEFDDWTRWFDLHSTAHIQQQRSDAYDWYSTQTKPIYRWEHDPNMVTAIYPREAIQQHFAQDGVPERDFWGSLAWMLALAIYEGFEQIELFWYTLDLEGEYRQQVGSALYWIGQARGRGIRVLIHGDSGLKPTGPMYGIETT